MYTNEKDQRQSKKYTVTQSEINKFAIISEGLGDIHTSPEYAMRTIFKKTLVHGLFLLALIEKEAKNQNIDTLKIDITFLKPILVDQEFRIIFMEKAEDAWEVFIDTLDMKAIAGIMY